MLKRYIGFLVFLVTFAGLGPDTASAAVGEVARSYVSGILVAPGLTPDASEEEWRNSLKNMKQIGIDTVIVQYSFQTDSLHGNQSYFDYWQEDTVKDAKKHRTRRKQIGHILEAAQQHGLKVFLGLQLAEREWFDEDEYRSYDWLYHHYWLSSDLANALWNAYGKAYGETIAGWYLPFELESSSEYYSYIDQITEAYYRPTTTYLKDDDRFGRLPIMISPLMYKDNNKDIWRYHIKSILSSSLIDIVAPQDGLGFGTQNQETVCDWYQATREAVDEVNRAYGRKRVSLWANCENYARLRNPNEPDPIERFKPMSINKYVDSLNLIGPYVEKIISFSIHRWDTAMYYNDFLGVNRSYYDAYSRYYNTGYLSVNKANGYYIPIRSVDGSDLTFDPLANAGLTDGLATDIGDSKQYKGISSPQRQPFIMEIRFDDPVSIKSISSHYYQDGESDIALPQEVKYEYLVRSGENDQVFTYTLIKTDKPTGREQGVLSVAGLPAPVMVDGIRIEVTPGGKWTFIDDVWVE